MRVLRDQKMRPGRGNLAAAGEAIKTGNGAAVAALLNEHARNRQKAARQRSKK